MKNYDNLDMSSISIGGVNRRDYPDFCDAYVESASWNDGTELTASELEELTEDRPDLINEMIHEDQLYL